MNQLNIFADLLNISADEEFLKIVDSYEKRIGATMDIITFVSLIYYNKDYENLIHQFKLTNKEKSEALRVIVALNNHIDLIENDDVSTDTLIKLGRTVLNIEDKHLLDISINILVAVVPESTHNQSFELYKKRIDQLRWVLGMKPIPDGHDIMKLFGVKGRQIKTFINKVIDLQIVNKECTREWVIELLERTRKN